MFSRLMAQDLDMSSAEIKNRREDTPEISLSWMIGDWSFLVKNLVASSQAMKFILKWQVAVVRERKENGN